MAKYKVSVSGEVTVFFDLAVEAATVAEAETKALELAEKISDTGAGWDEGSEVRDIEAFETFTEPEDWDKTLWFQQKILSHRKTEEPPCPIPN